MFDVDKWEGFLPHSKRISSEQHAPSLEGLPNKKHMNATIQLIDNIMLEFVHFLSDFEQ